MAVLHLTSRSQAIDDDGIAWVRMADGAWMRDGRSARPRLALVPPLADGSSDRAAPGPSARVALVGVQAAAKAAGVRRPSAECGRRLL